VKFKAIIHLNRRDDAELITNLKINNGLRLSMNQALGRKENREVNINNRHF
jgi:hypothetical protein